MSQNSGEILLPQANIMDSESQHKLPKTSTCRNPMLIAKVVCGFICFAEIMMEIMVDDTLWVSDSATIYYIQSAFSTTAQKALFKIGLGIEFWSNPIVMSVILIALYNAYDPLVSVKTAYVIYYALLIRNVAAVLLFQEPRPFWIDNRINGVSCTNTMSGPSEPMLVAVFTFIYIIRLAYVHSRIKRLTMIILIVLFSINALAIFFFQLVIGANFLFQSISGILIGSVMVIGAISFDKYLTHFIIKIGFIEEKARQQMIILMIKQFIYYLLIYGVVAVLPVDYNIPIDWIRNFKVFSLAEISCPNKELNNTTLFFIPMRHIMFSMGIPAMSFGMQFIIQKMPPFWWETNVCKRVVRGIIALVVSLGIFIGFLYIPSEDVMTGIVFNYLIPIFIAHFIGMGLLPLLFKAMNLVNTDFKLSQLKPEFDDSMSQSSQEVEEMKKEK